MPEKERRFRSHMLTVDEANEKFPIGTPVKYWPMALGDDKTVGEGFIRSEAWDVCGSTVMLVTGYIGGIHIDHIVMRCDNLHDSEWPYHECDNTNEHCRYKYYERCPHFVKPFVSPASAKFIGDSD